jgi:hypothetical protein
VKSVGKILTLLFLVLFVAYFTNKLWPNEPEIKYSDTSMESGISQEQALDIVKDSSSYKLFDMRKRIISIYVKHMPYEQDDPDGFYKQILETRNIAIDSDMYMVRVTTSDRCFSTTQKDFFVDFKGDILFEENMVLC